MEVDINILERLNDDLIQKAREMEQLVAHVAHELLTPITSVLMSADYMIDHYEGDENYSDEELLEFAKIISRNSIDLKNQAVNILNFFSSRQVKTTLVSPSKIISNCIKELKLQTDVEIRFRHSDGNKTNILTSEESIKTIVSNLLSNAIKFTEANERNTKQVIEITLKDVGRHVSLKIRDSGIGIEEELIESKNLFEFGKRGSNAKGLEVRGYGVGLTTVKRLLDSLGGLISFSRVYPCGTEVEVRIPKAEDLEEVI